MAELGTGRVRQEIRPEDLLDELRDTEITLGTGKLLGIFFGLVIVCAVFFTMGYLLGKSSIDGAHTQIVGTTLSASSAAGKPSAETKQPDTPPAPSPDATQQSSTAATSDSSTAASTPAATAPADIKSSPTGSFLVQVAAVSKQEDAEILVSALRKKQYPVFIANIPGDPLFHVQVGPFSTQLDAETMRNRLAGDGYNAIVKH